MSSEHEDDDGEDTTTDDDASQTTEDDPQIPENVALPPPPPVQPPPPPVQQAPPPPRERPHYELRHTMTGHTKSISAVKFSPDGTLLASSGGYMYIQFNYLFSLADPRACATQAADQAIKIWSPATGKLVRNLVGHTKGNSDVAWSSDSVHLASASDDKTVRIWDVDSVC